MTRWLNVLNWLWVSAGKVTCTNQSCITDQSQPGLQALSQSHAAFTQEDPPPTTDRIGLARLFTKTSKHCSKCSLFFHNFLTFFQKGERQLLRVCHGFTNLPCWSRNPSLHVNSFLSWWSDFWFSAPLFWSRASTAHVTPTSLQADLVGSSCTSKCYIM